VPDAGNPVQLLIDLRQPGSNLDFAKLAAFDEQAVTVATFALCGRDGASLSWTPQRPWHADRALTVPPGE
jgi:hypothetical protein